MRSRRSPNLRPWAAGLILSFLGSAGTAGSPSLFPRETGPSEARGPDLRGSLLGSDGGVLFARSAPAAAFRRDLPEITAPLPVGGRDRALFDLIALAEAGHAGYDAVQAGARIPPPAPPTKMTIGGIFAWIKATPGQHHAIGRYQIVPATLRALVGALEVPEDAVFSPSMQDRLAQELLSGAGYEAFLGGEIGRPAFMRRLAKVWAGLPLASGRSYYHGVSGNRATISRARFEAEMKRIFPSAPELADQGRTGG